MAIVDKGTKLVLVKRALGMRETRIIMYLYLAMGVFR
jgi:hypothetical protein